LENESWKIEVLGVFCWWWKLEYGRLIFAIYNLFATPAALRKKFNKIKSYHAPRYIYNGKGKGGKGEGLPVICVLTAFIISVDILYYI
jgi:hypothetical protein